MSSRAFSAKSGQSEAGSTTTGSTFLPRSPPWAFSSAICMIIWSFRIVSLIAIVPDSECRIPTLMVSSARARSVPPHDTARIAAAARSNGRRVGLMSPLLVSKVTQGRGVTNRRGACAAARSRRSIAWSSAEKRLRRSGIRRKSHRPTMGWRQVWRPKTSDRWRYAGKAPAAQSEISFFERSLL